MISLTAKKAVATSSHATASPTPSSKMAAQNTTPTVAPTAAATPSFLRRAKTRVVDFFLPEFLRREYRNLIVCFSENRYKCIAIAVTVLFAAAEYEQPGYFPWPSELTTALVCDPAS
jgi:hypothetical protein